MKFYGYQHFNHNDYGCCPGHDRIFCAGWHTRTCQTTKRLKRYPKKVARQRIKENLRQYISS